MKRFIYVGVFLALLCLTLGAPNRAGAFTMWSTKDIFTGAGTFFGPGNLPDSVLFDAVIHNIAFSAPSHMITPFFNNGGTEPNVCAESVFGPFGAVMSDGVTRVNENVDVCAFTVAGIPALFAVIDGGPHAGEQLADIQPDGTVMTMTMDFGFDFGGGRVLRVPFKATTASVTIPFSLQTQQGLPGGIDQAGSLPSGSTLTGRLGDFDRDGFIDGGVVLAGNIPLESPIFPGAPYALIRTFVTDLPVKGIRVGRISVPHNNRRD